MAIRDTTSRTFTWCLVLVFLVSTVCGQCPWSRELVELHTDCVCAYSNSQRLSIQCSPVNFTKLVDVLRASVKSIPIDLLYVNNSTIEILANDAFKDLHIQSLHLSRSKIRSIEPNAFVGLENSLTSLNLQDNLLREIPVQSIQNLTSLQLLDLSHNLIKVVSDEAFKGLPLSTLKLSDNHMTVSSGGFSGLEGTLKNLNLQAAELDSIPVATQRLKALAFLDLAQNKITAVEPGFLAEMQSLTALNLERNRISNLDSKAFLGVNATLSSLSLLNNALNSYPIEALNLLTEIRVLDLGFNGISTLPTEAFTKNKYLTLLALDGNPLNTVQIDAFLHLNSTLRGLSIGGSSLVCDCRIRWISEWVRDRGLQVTSRERNPQFCGHPEHLKRRSFLQLLPSDFACDNETSTRPTKRPKRLPSDYDERRGVSNVVKSKGELDPKLQILTLGTEISVSDSATASTETIPTDAPSRSLGTSRVSRKEQPPDIRIKHAFKRDSTLFIEWDSKESLRGFQVVIRMFGSRDFKRILPIPRDQRKIQVENLPLSQCLVVCVIEYEEVSTIKVENMPQRQCRELKGDDNRIVSMDKIVICASAIICVVVIIGALTIILFHVRRRDPHLSTVTSTPMPGSIPIIKTETEWETLSWNSGRSTPKTPHGNFLKPGSTSHNFVLGPPHPKLANGFSKSYSTHDNESRLSYTHLAKGQVPDVKRSKSLTRPAGYHPYGGSNFIKKKKNRCNGNGRLASASSAQSSTECESDWNSRSMWKDNDVDIYISQNHHMVSGNNNTKHRKDYIMR